jgi:hypothetical protein
MRTQLEAPIFKAHKGNLRPGCDLAAMLGLYSFGQPFTFLIGLNTGILSQ